MKLPDLSRRAFFQSSLASSAVLRGAAAAGAQSNSDQPVDAVQPATDQATMVNVPFSAVTPRLGLIGAGGRGTNLLENLLAADVTVNAICDVVKDKADHAAGLVQKAGQKTPAVYADGDHAYEMLAKREDLDLIVIATPWNWHTKMAVTAMTNGKHVAVEVPAATTIEECWQLVNTSEKTRRHCMMLENCAYGYNETLILNMIRAGMFGDLLYGAGGYIHDLRQELFSNAGEGLWRRTVHTQRNGNLYPTHGLGPVANYMRINRGDRFDYLVSMSTPHRGLEKYREEHISKTDDRWKESYVAGDMNMSLIKTVNGLVINLQHDTVNPHPYDRINQIAGTKAVFQDYPPRLYVDGQAGEEAWTSIDEYKAQFEHPLWKQEGEIARKIGGHGGMDFIMLYRLIECMRKGLPPDMDVYDAASWSAPTPLSQTSVAQGSMPGKFPDFTRGHWQDRNGSSIGRTNS